MSESNYVEISKQNYEAFMRGDVAAVLETYDDEIEFVVNGAAGSAPFVGTFKGKAEVIRLFGILGETFEYHSMNLIDIIAQDNKVAVIVETSGIIRATGQQLISREAHIATFRNGKVVRVDTFGDNSIFTM